MKAKYRIVKRHHHFSNSDDFTIERKPWIGVWNRCVLDVSFSSGIYCRSSLSEAMNDLNRLIADEKAGFKPHCECWATRDSGYGYTAKEVVYQTSI